MKIAITWVLSRQWPELPISAMDSNIFLSKFKFVLNVQLPSTKYIQCQVVLRKSLKSSTDQEIKELWQCTSSNMNVLYDNYQNSKSVLKALEPHMKKGFEAISFLKAFLFIYKGSISFMLNLCLVTE